MELQHIELENLKTTALNVRKIGAKDIADLVPSIRSLGLLQPLLVRQNCDGFEIIAGQRRFYALQKLSEEQSIEPVPCIIMAKGDDAKAIEASLAENIARLPMDEIDQYKAFASLVKQGQSADEIATLFGITERLVTQRLAIANLISPILTLYRKEEIQATTIRILTMATKRQQKDWLALFNTDDEYAPEGYQLKNWLFGGANIPTENALFDLADYGGGIIADLFGEEQYFDDIAKFWELQNTAIAKTKDTYLADGWQDVLIMDVGDYFPAYEYVDTAKEDGGKVYVRVSNDGEVTFFEGQLSRKESKAKLNVDNGEITTTAKPELTKAMQNYLGLHRHSAVRTELLKHGGISLRLGLAQMIAGSELWTIHADPQKANSDAIGGSLDENTAESAFIEQRKAVLELLGIEGDADDTLVGKKSDWQKSHDLHTIFAKLISLSDDEVMTIQTFVIAETLPSGSAMVEVLGDMLNVDMAQSWSPDQTFFDLHRDKPAINAMLKQVAGKITADAHISSTAKVQKKIIQDCLNGTRKGKKQNWQPSYMAFPMADYTKRGGIEAMVGWDSVKKNYD